MAAGKTH